VSTLQAAALLLYFYIIFYDEKKGGKKGTDITCAPRVRGGKQHKKKKIPADSIQI